jgi:hypothetical protein
MEAACSGYLSITCEISENYSGTTSEEGRDVSMLIDLTRGCASILKLRVLVGANKKKQRLRNRKQG